MAGYVMMPSADYQAVCDAVRAKTKKSGVLKSGQLPAEIRSIQTDTSGDTSFLEYLSGERYALSVPAGAENIKNYAFYKDGVMTSVTLPEGLKTIGTEAFRECGLLTTVTIPASVEQLSYRAFGYNSNLETVVFQGKPNEIKSDTFASSGVYDIYVPWDEREVPNAPWGAISATIHYKSEVGA